MIYLNMLREIKLTYIIPFLLLIFCVISPVYSDNVNVLTNPGFESGTTSWAARAGCSFAVATTPTPHTGTYCGRGYGRTQTYQGIKQSLIGKLQTGQSYAFSGWVRTSTSASSQVKITVEKTLDGTTTYTQAASGTASNSGWVKISGSYTLASYSGSLTTLDIYFEGPASGVELYVDDANVYGPGSGGPSSVVNATAQLSTSSRYQVLDGFGAAGGWYEGNVLNYSEPTRTNLYNTMFHDLGLDIYRVRNTYGYDSAYITHSAQIIQAANTSLGHPIRVMNCSWGPPAYLKSNNNDSNGGTLIKDANGNYKYTQFAQWWRDALTAWTNAGVNSYYLSMQNEPQWSATWQTCLFDPTENTSHAGYKQAFAAFYANLNTLPNRPKLIAPESMNLSGTAAYINAFDTTDKANIYGFSHHLYDGSGDTPDQLVSAMATFKNNYGYKPLMMTEYDKGPSDTVLNKYNWTDAINLAILVNNCLTVENASAYVYWELFWASPTGLVSLTSPNYTINTVYYAFKHFSYFTDPNWQRIGFSTSSTSVRTSAYINPDNNKISIILINTSTVNDVNLSFTSLGNFEVSSGNLYRSSATENCIFAGSYSSTILVPANSIMTVVLNGTLLPANCAEVQAFGYGLLSDLNGDCSVDYKDLYIISDKWLNTDCAADNYCEGADFPPTDGTVNFVDFSTFALQWMQCNDPLNTNCTPNW